ncbi:MAG TPA: serine hydrolase domain-containing protein [Janthinobacterium sp.]|nr:serine hydrolase domain-containing protein [Janthinobacterium sp.]
MLLTACGTLSRMELDADGTAVPRYASGDLRAEADSLALPLIQARRTPGLVIGVLLPDGSRQCFGYGETEAEGGQRPDGDTLFAIGSVSKGFLSATAAILVQEGVLSWDDTLEKLLPPGTPLSPSSKQITLLQLATHTSGLPRQPFTPRTLLYFVEYLFTGQNFYRHLDRDYLLGYLAGFDAPAVSEPRYSNIGYALLGYVMELRTGKKVDGLVHEKILWPLRLANTAYVPEQLAGYADRARGHAGDQPKFIRRGEPVPDWQFTDVLAGSAALYSSANDLLTYAAAHLHGSGDAMRDRALQDTLAVRVNRPKEAAALAWIVDDIGGRKITYQIGLVAGYTSYIGMDVANKTAVVVLQNSFNWTNGIGHRLLLRMADGARKLPREEVP